MFQNEQGKRATEKTIATTRNLKYTRGKKIPTRTGTDDVRDDLHVIISGTI